MSSAPLQSVDGERPELERIEASRALGESGVAPLLAYLDDRSWVVRRAAIAALASLGPAAAKQLCQVLKEQRTSENRLAAAVDALVLASALVEPDVLELCESARPAVVCDGIQILGRRRAQRAVPLLARFATHPDDNVSMAAIEALGRIGGNGSVDALLPIVASRHFFRTFPALDVLGRSGDPRAIGPLSALLEDPLFGAEAIRALGHTSSERAVPRLLFALDSDSDIRRRTAAVALVEIHDRVKLITGTARSVEQMIAEGGGRADRVERMVAGLASASTEEQAAVCRLLGWMGSQEASEALIGLADLAPEVVASTLARVGPIAEGRLREAVRQGDSSRRRLLLPLLRGRKAGIDEALACLDDPDPAVRILACDVIARSMASHAVPKLFAHLDDPDLGVVQAVVGAIQSLGSDQTEQLALAAGWSGKAGVRRSGLRILAYFGFRSGLSLLLEALEGPDDRARELAIAGLPLFEEAEALAALLSCAERPNPKTRAASMRALGHTPVEPGSSAALQAGLTDADPWVRYYAAQSLGRRREEVAVAGLVQLLSDPAGQVQVAAVEALSHLESPASTEGLERAVSSSDADVQRAALLGLGLKTRQQSLKMLVAAASSPEASTRLVVISALARQDPTATLPVLLGLARDPDAAVQAAALGALGELEGVAVGWGLVELLELDGCRDRVVELLSQPKPGRLAILCAALQRSSAQRAPSLAAALLQQGSPAANDALVAAVYAGEVEGRRASVQALRRVVGPEAQRALELASRHDDDEEVRRLSLEALSGR